MPAINVRSYTDIWEYLIRIRFELNKYLIISRLTKLIFDIQTGDQTVENKSHIRHSHSHSQMHFPCPYHGTVAQQTQMGVTTI